MVHIYTGSNTTTPIGRIQDYNNTNPSKGVAAYRNLTALSPQTFTSSHMLKKASFASAIYGDGPYSLNCPNVTSDILAKNIDFIA